MPALKSPTSSVTSYPCRSSPAQTHTHQRAGDLSFRHHLGHQLPCVHPLLLYFHFPSSLQDPFCSGQMESLLHLQLTPHRGVTKLGHHLHCVPAACISRSSQKDKVPALMCGVVIPMLNPFIYSLRNKDMKAALRKLVGKVAPSQS